MNSFVVGFGPFTRSIVEHLDYLADWYDGVEEGAEVVTHLFECNTREQSKNLTDALGVEPFDFGTHCITSIDQVSWEKLKEASDDGWEWLHHDIEGFRMLLTAGFKFFFCPGA